MSQKRYAYLIGANGPEGMRLKHAEEDVLRLAEALKTPNPCHFAEAVPVIAHTRQSALGSFKAIIDQCNPSDLLLVHFSGHAIFDEQLYLLCNETNLDDIFSSALEITTLKTMLRRCKARNKLLILDCCHAAGASGGALGKSEHDIRGVLNEEMKGSATIILSACARKERTREFDDLDGGSGFLSWALRAACTTHFEEVTSDRHARTLSFHDIWKWLPNALEYVNTTMCQSKPLPPPILVSELESGSGSEIWLTDLPRTSQPILQKRNETRRKYLEAVYQRYSTLALPIGPAEGLPLPALFQPLWLRSDPLVAGDLEHASRRLLLGEDWLEQHGALDFKGDEKEHGIAECAESALQQSQHGRIVVLGGPGTGKTTTLKYLIGRQAKKALVMSDEHLPIFLSLADLARTEKTFPEYLVFLVEDMGIERSFATTLWEELEQGRVFVALDSLDEVAPDQRNRMFNIIHGLSAKAGNTWIIGSRFTEYKGGQFKQGLFSEWELLPMTSQLCIELASKLFPLLQSTLATLETFVPSPKHFVEELDAHPQTKAWGENPLLFSLASIVYIKAGGLPGSRAKLYQEVIDAIIAFREPHSFNRKHILRELAGFALWLHQHKGRTFTSDDVLAYFKDEQQKNWHEIEDISQRMMSSGILDIVARDTYGFRHQTFQEYLAATELSRRILYTNGTSQQQIWDYLWSKRRYSRWAEVLKLFVEVLVISSKRGVTEATHWLKMLSQEHVTTIGDPGLLSLKLALKTLNDVALIDEWRQPQTLSLEKELLWYWIQASLQLKEGPFHRRTEKFKELIPNIDFFRGEASDFLRVFFTDELSKALDQQNISRAQALLSLGTDFPIELLERVLHDKYASLRRAAVSALGEMGNRASVVLLLEAFHDIDESVRKASILALSQLGERVPVDHLLAALDDPDAPIRWLAVETLGRQSERVPVEPLLAALHDSNKIVRGAVVELLSKLGDRVPQASLLATLYAPNERVRYAAVHVLSNLGKYTQLSPLLAVLDDPDEEVRCAVLEILGKLGKRVPLDPILAVLDDPSVEVRSAALEALGNLGERVPLDPLLAALDDPDEEVRRTALEALGNLGERVPLDLLLSALSDPDEGVRCAALEALGKLGERVLLDPLLLALSDPDEGVRRAALKALSKQGERVPLDPVLLTLDDPDEGVRRAALEALSNLGEHVPLDPLLSALHDPNQYVRSTALKILGMLGDRVPLEPLLVALHDSDETVKRTAARSLMQLQRELTLDWYLQSHIVDNPIVYCAALEILGMLGERVPLDVLLRALHNPDKRVRYAALEALGNLGERVPQELLLSALDDPDTQVRRVALKALGNRGEHVLLDPLLSALRDPDWTIRHNVPKILGKLGERVPLDPLLAALHDPDAEVRRTALEVLGELGERVPLDPLLSALDDPDAGVRRIALEALGKLRERVPLDPLLAAFYDQSWGVRLAALEALGNLGERVPLNLLLSALDDPDTQVRLAALEILSKLGECAPLDRLLSALDNPGSGVRCTALEALGNLGERAPLEPLLSALHNSDKYVRRTALKTLGKLGERVPLDPLLSALHDPDEEVKRMALEALGNIRKPVPLEPLLEILHDTNTSVRCTALQILGKLGERVPLNPFLVALHDPDAEVRCTALQTLEVLKINISEEMLIEMLGDMSTFVRTTASRLLSQKNSEKVYGVVEEMVAVLQKRESSSILASLSNSMFADAIVDSSFGTPQTLKDLISLLHWPYWQVQLKAIQALGRLRRNIPDKAIEQLLELRLKPGLENIYIRQTADETLAELLSLEGIEDD
ncbi:HEAT repeat domain-containing protein [Ktedonobacter robiniae]|uniref:HEAT repeat domain-containing protein n=1 Tax=Ktedonobacter robiniae TaxID=2778365 RepID=UPI0019158151|nr:HEAT repeat domain-containing protein [Ktedonobacter robiniae]